MQDDIGIPETTKGIGRRDRFATTQLRHPCELTEANVSKRSGKGEVHAAVPARVAAFLRPRFRRLYLFPLQ